MASYNVIGLDELNAAFGRIGNVPWDVTEKALGGMAEVAARKIKEEGEAMGVRDPESHVHILDKIKPAKAKETDSGGVQYITFSGSRTRGKNRKQTRNAEIAFVNEFGKQGQPARPFIKSAIEKSGNEISEPGMRILEDWIEYEYQR